MIARAATLGGWCVVTAAGAVMRERERVTQMELWEKAA